MIDGANVAFFGQNREGGGFRWDQIMAMYRLLRESHPGKRILLVREGWKGEREQSGRLETDRSY